MAMTAMSVENSLCNFTQFFAVGLADATSMLIGVLYGEMNDEGISESKRCIYRNCAIFCGAVCVLFLIFARPIAAFYIKEADEQLLDMASFAICMVALQAPVNGIVRSRITYLQAIGRTRNMQALTFVSSLVYVVGCAFALGALFGAYGIFASYFVSDLLTLATVWVFYCIKTRKPRHSRSAQKKPFLPNGRNGFLLFSFPYEIRRNRNPRSVSPCSSIKRAKRVRTPASECSK